MFALDTNDQEQSLVDANIFQILNLKSQISNLKSQVSSLKPTPQDTPIAQPLENTNLADDGSANQENEVDNPSRATQSEITGISQQDAENVTRRVQEASPTTQGAKSSQRQLKQQQDKELESLAREMGTFISDPKETFGEELAGGQEQDVYLNNKRDKVIKVNGLFTHTRWADFWERLRLQEELFPSTAY